MNISAEKVINQLDTTFWEKQGVNLSFIIKLFSLYAYELLYADIMKSREGEITKLYLVISYPNNIYSFSGNIVHLISLDEFEEDTINLLEVVLSYIHYPASESGQPIKFNTYLKNCELGYINFCERFYGTGLFEPFHQKRHKSFIDFLKMKD